MRTGPLLEELLTIAKMPKTDFAVCMNMTPSGLSKILTGRRLLFFKEKRIFSRQAAEHLAEAIYCHGCYTKFENIFPVIYDFNTKYELGLFLAQAIEYSLDKDLAAENDEGGDYPDREMGFLGKKTILNMFCVAVSDYVVNDNGMPLEFYSALPLYNHLYSDIFRRIKILSTGRQKSIAFNHFFDMSSFESSYDECSMDILSRIVKAQQYFDLNLWEKDPGSSFLLLKGQFLLVFSIQIDGTPFMSWITHKGYITVFFNSLMKKGAKKISYNRSEAIAILESDPSLITSLLDRNVDAVYNFISIGYLIKKAELNDVKCAEPIKEIVLQFFNDVLTKGAAFFVTIDAMMGFCATGKAIVPLIGAIDFAPDKRIPYLRRFESYINENSASKIRIINSDLPRVAVFCAQGVTVVYLIDHTYQSEKIHYFKTDMLNNVLRSEVAESPMKIMDFSPDLWTTYMDELSKYI
jgi:hypothetical protein